MLKDIKVQNKYNNSKQYSDKQKTQYYLSRSKDSNLTKEQRKFAKSRLKSLLKMNNTKPKKVKKRFIGNGIAQNKVTSISTRTGKPGRNGKLTVIRFQEDSPREATYFNNLFHAKEFRRTKDGKNAPKILGRHIRKELSYYDTYKS